MLALETVVARHGSALILDAASTRVQAGFVQDGCAPAWITTDDEAGVGLFRSVAGLLGTARIKPQEVGAYVFCDGPGSQLGIRTAGMAIRTWQVLRAKAAPIFTYRSLRLAAHGMVGAESPAPPFAVVCDARRESWHVACASEKGMIGGVERLPAEEVAALRVPLFQPEGFRCWAEHPVPIGTCNYTCGNLFSLLGRVELLEPSEDAEPWNPAPQDYKKWTGDRHRAPTPSSDSR